MEIKFKLASIISDLFKIEINDINENTGMDNVPDWDSLNTLRLVLEIENSFKISLDPQDIENFQDFKSILKIIKQKKE